MADEADIILSELSDDELVLQMHDDLYDGLKEEIEEGVNILISKDDFVVGHLGTPWAVVSVMGPKPPRHFANSDMRQQKADFVGQDKQKSLGLVAGLF